MEISGSIISRVGMLYFLKLMVRNLYYIALPVWGKIIYLTPKRLMEGFNMSPTNPRSRRESKEIVCNTLSSCSP